MHYVFKGTNSKVVAIVIDEINSSKAMANNFECRFMRCAFKRSNFVVKDSPSENEILIANCKLYRNKTAHVESSATTKKSEQLEAILSNLTR